MSYAFATGGSCKNNNTSDQRQRLFPKYESKMTAEPPDFVPESVNTKIIPSSAIFIEQN
ncbi:MAG: hypothetical protein ACQERC_02275 [Bacteroidota bacterium]